jgi:hypothetical protein
MSFTGEGFEGWAWGLVVVALGAVGLDVGGVWLSSADVVRIAAMSGRVRICIGDLCVV